MQTKRRQPAASKSEKNTITNWREPFVLFGLLAVILIIYVVLHFRAGYTLPLPWPDEAHFMWQANGFAERFSLFAPEINPERTIFWMPPGYLIALGIVLKIFGLGLAVARGFSLALMLAAICLMAVLVRQYRMPVFSLVLAALFVLGPPFVAAGNVARMEAFLIATLLVGFILMQRGRVLLGLCVLALSPLIHPNGVYFFGAGTIVALLTWGRPWRFRRPDLAESILLAGALAAWIGYGIYATLNWQHFISDMTFQFERKAARDVLSPLVAPHSIAMIAAFLVSAFYCFRHKLRVGFLFAIVLPAWWTAAAGFEMWYRLFFSVCFTLFAVIAFNVILHFVQTRSQSMQKLIGSLVLGMLAICVLGWNAYSAPVGHPLTVLDTRKWYGMEAKNEPYITDGDIQALTQILGRLPRDGRPLVVEFYPAADAFFFAGKIPDIQVSYPLFWERQPDWFLMHISTSFPRSFNKYAIELLDKQKISDSELLQTTVHGRGSTESWSLISGNRVP